MIMKTTLLLITLSLSMVAGTANAAPKKGKPVGDGLRRKKSLVFDGRSIEALRAGNYDSVSHLSDGNGANGSKKLYSLPRDFSNRVADEGMEMRYRQ